MSGTATPPAGWYPDPDNGAQTRYWDGTAWTQHTELAPSSTPPPPTSSPSSFAPPPPGVGAAPAASSPAPGARKKWIIGGGIAAGVIIVGSVGAAFGSGGRAESQAPPSNPAVLESTPAPDPTVTSPNPQPEPEPAVASVDAVAFRAQSNSHLDDMNKDLDDLVVTVQEDGFWRLLSNFGELSFNVGQLESLDVPATVGATWPESLLALDSALTVLSDAIGTEDGPTILAAVDTVRAQVEGTRGVANSAQ